MGSQTRSGICSIELISPPGDSLVASGIIEEREQALRNLLTDKSFQPCGDDTGPYALRLSIEDNRLIFYIRNANDVDLTTLILSLRPYRRVVQDYFLMLESYEQAKKYAGKEKLEAIDMGRRSVHNEGADLLLARLENKITMDHETARKIFTLICALHTTNVRLAGGS